MKYILSITSFIAGLLLLQSCTKTESNFEEDRPETITIGSSSLNVTTGATVSFTVLSSVNNSNVTQESEIYVNGSLITGSTYTFTNAGNYTIFATKGSVTSTVITINVSAPVANTAYKHNVLVEEYSGTWCGNCPRILHGVDLLLQQTDKAIVVSTHLFNGDPFITTKGNDLAAQQGVNGVPTGFINRTINWTGPQYENVSQVINNIQASADAGIAIRSTINNNTLSVVVSVATSLSLPAGGKLTVYLVEDKLFTTQRNYSANLYGGQASISNFQYDGVLRDVVSALGGDNIGSSGNANQNTYSLTIPANIADIRNARIVAFITNSSGTVINAQQAKVGTEKAFEIL